MITAPQSGGVSASIEHEEGVERPLAAPPHGAARRGAHDGPHFLPAPPADPA